MKRREIAHTRLEVIAGADNPYSLITIFGRGHLAIKAVGAVYVTRCAPVEVLPWSHKNCTEEIPVTTKGTEAFVGTISYVIKSAGSLAHCNNIARHRYKVGDKWYCSYPDLREYHDPAMLPVDKVKIDLVTVNNIGLGKSIYTKEQLEEFAMFQDSQGARKAYLAETAELAYMGRNEKREWGLALGSAAQVSLVDFVGMNPFPLYKVVGPMIFFLSLLLMVWGGLRLVVTIFLRVAIIVRYRGCGVWLLTAFWSTLFQLAISPSNWIDGIMEDMARRGGVMSDNEATCAPAGEEAEEQSLEDLRRKYPWWLGGQGDVEASAPAQESSAEADNTVTLFAGKTTRVRRDEDDIIKGSVSDRLADVVDVVYVNM